MNEISRAILRLIFSIGVIFVGGLFSLVAVSRLPVVSMEQNVNSALTRGYLVDGPIHRSYHFLGKTKNFTDNYTECAGINVALLQDGTLKNAILAPLAVEEGVHGCAGLKKVEAKKFNTSRESYGRYFHGYVPLVRLLYSTLSFHAIRCLTFFMAFISFGVLLFSIYQKINLITSLIVFFCFTLTQTSICYETTYAVHFFMIIIFSLLVLLRADSLSPISFFGISGAFDGYFTFMNMGNLSLTIPLLLYVILLCRKREDNKMIVKKIFISSLSWLFGLISIWGGKIALSFYYLQGHMDVALRKRSTHNFFELVDGIVCAFQNLYLRDFVAACVLVIGYRGFRYLRGGGASCNKTSLLLVGILPILWIGLTAQHSVVHPWMDNFMLWPTCASILLFFLPEAISPQK